jgi:hypothetical protein
MSEEGKKFIDVRTLLNNGNDEERTESTVDENNTDNYDEPDEEDGDEKNQEENVGTLKHTK